MRVLVNRNNVFIDEQNWSFSDEVHYELVSYTTLAMTITFQTAKNTLEVHMLVENTSRTTRRHINEFIDIVCDEWFLGEHIRKEIANISKRKSFKRMRIE